MCGSWYLPMLRLRGGSCTHMNIASLMVLDWLCTSLCMILNWLGSSGCPVVVLCRCIGEGALRCSLTLFPRDLPDSHTFGTSLCDHCQYSNQNQHKHKPTMPTTTSPTGTPTPCPPTPLPLSIHVGGHHNFLTFIPIGKYTHTPPYTPLSLSTCRPTAVPSW